MRALALLTGVCACSGGGKETAGSALHTADTGEAVCALTLAEAGTVSTEGACQGPGSYDGVDLWDVERKWDWTADQFGSHNMPAVGNLTDDNRDGLVDDDDVPDVAVTDYSYTLTLLDGATGLPHWSLDEYDFEAGVSMADVDGDGVNELIALTHLTNHVVALDGDGEVEWSADSYPFLRDYYPQSTVADLDGDGLAEVIMDQLVINGEDGSLAFELETPLAPFGTPVAADLDGDGSMEILLAESVYDAEGELLWQGELSEVGAFWAVVNADDDPEGEALEVTWAGGAWLYDSDGSLIRDLGLDIETGGPPCVGDLDADGEPDLIVPAGDALVALNVWGDVRWEANVPDTSGAAGCATFDFDEDGASEVVYAGSDDLAVLDGRTGAVLFDDPTHRSDTLWEYPVVADLDADGSADIVATSVEGGASGARAYGQVKGRWAPAGAGWGTHDYAEVNVLADGAVVAQPTPSWLVADRFRSRPSRADRPAPDLTVEVTGWCVDTCPTGALQVAVQVVNQGSAAAPAGVPITLYAVSGSDRYAAQTLTLPDAIAPGEALAGLLLEGPVATFGPEGFVVAIDDDGGGGRSVRDCRRDNNEAAVVEPLCGDY